MVKKEKELNVEEMFQGMSHKEHILELPDTYIGSVELDSHNMRVYDEKLKKIIPKKIEFVPGFYKIFDEILVNAIDHSVVDKTCKNIMVDIDVKESKISVYNDGDGIPVQIHKKEKIYIPEMIFGNLLTSGNYRKKGKTVGGKNGLGAKCISIDTNVLLWNGNITKAKNINVGDKLIGDDGKIRTVMDIFKGKGEMYQIDQLNGSSYCVNDKHILTLCMPDHKKIYWNSFNKLWKVQYWDNKENNIKTKLSSSLDNIEEYISEIEDNNIIDIPIKKYLSLNICTQKSLHGLRGKCVEWEAKKTLIDPYFYGKSISNMNEIPDLYKINSIDNRKKLLAGIIDKFGVIINNIQLYLRFNNEYSIVKDIMYIIRSLGLNCNKYNIGDNINIYVYGNLNMIPANILYNYNGYNNSNNGYLDIKNIGIGEYVGITIDNNQRFLIEDFTVTHNCANIYSKHFWIETLCAKTNKKYKQHFYDNMYKKDEPIIKKVKSGHNPYTKITFIPDLKRFGMENLDPDIVSLFKKRVYDCAGCTNNRVNVFLNGELLDIKNFEDYIKMFIPQDDNSEDKGTYKSSKPIYEKVNDRWEVGVVYDPVSSYNQISYVNGICTYQGGTHVNNVTDKIVNALMKIIKDKHKNLNIKNSQIKDNLTVFVNSTIEDPSFNSQVKEFLTTKVTNYGSKCEIGTEFIKKIAKTGIIDSVVNFAKLKEMSEMKKSDGKKKIRLKGMEKLDDAGWAGGRKSQQTTLILTEGDSAKPFALKAREVVGHDRIGVYPLKGKPLNVREATAKQLKTNEEIASIKQILGLKQGQRYKSIKDLRYGNVLVLTDSDVDGTHIKGLILNLFHFFWPSLLKINGFVQSYATPIVKAFKKNDKKGIYTKKFYTLSEYRKWEGNKESLGYSIKYYKGLGTSTSAEAKEAFQNFDKNVINYVWDSMSETKKNTTTKIEVDSESSDDIVGDECNTAINLAFAKIASNKRKEWLNKYNKDNYIENSVKTIPISMFVNDDLIHFSNYDNIRSIPSLFDGLKPSQRKILYGSFKRGLAKPNAPETKVAQLSGYISDIAQYHHGETSLQGAIIGMAQDFVGSNNLNLLMPIGQFGTRLKGGKDSASARYIFTKLEKLVPYIFRDEDKYVIDHVYEDGQKIEPETYPGIIPLILINGCEGIGTGFSTNIPCFNVHDIYNNLIRLIDGKEPKEMIPYYRNFNGNIKKVDEYTYESEGIYDIVNETTIRITELPIKTWTDDYKKFLEESISDDPKNSSDKKFISSYSTYCTDTKVNFEIELCKGVLQNLQKNNVFSKNKNTLKRKFKLKSNIKISNMHLYNSKNIIQKYTNVKDILISFYEIRKNMYIKRKEYWIKHLENQMNVCYYRKKYIELVLKKKIVVMKKKELEVIKQIEDYKFPKLNMSYADAPEDTKSYDYIKKLLIFHLTHEKMEELDADYLQKSKDLNEYKKLSIENIWKKELEEFMKQYKIWETEKQYKLISSTETKKQKKNIRKKRINKNNYG